MQPHSSLVRSVAPSVRPISLSEAKDHCRVSHTDDDAYIDQLIDVAVASVDGKGKSGRALITQTWQQSVGQEPGAVRALMTPFQSLTAVHYYDDAGLLQEATLAEFEAIGLADETYIRPKDGYSWPSADDRPDAIRLTYTAGYGDSASAVPASIRHALLMMVAHWYENRETVSADKMIETPYAADHLLSLERMGWYG